MPRGVLKLNLALKTALGYEFCKSWMLSCLILDISGIFRKSIWKF